MKWVFAGLIATHGLVHFLGFVKAFGIAELPQLTQPISRGMGLAWLAGGLALVATGVLVLIAPGSWWKVGFAAVVLSQTIIISSWSDARFGTPVNLLVLAGVVYGFVSEGPPSFRREYLREVRERVAESVSPPLVTEADLAALPEPVRRYLHATGAVGQPRVHHFNATWRGRIRGTATDPWMSFIAEQYNFPGEPSRFFLMDATRTGLPVDVFHAFRSGSATMRVRLLSLWPLVDASGPEMNQAETVTLLNDLCLLAPGALIDPAIRWDVIDDRSARAHYTVGSNTISAVLSFNEVGELVDFVSDDRYAVSPGGTSFTRQRWSTPVGEYRRFGTHRAMTRGEGRWYASAGEFVYIDLELLELEFNGAGP